MGDTGGQAVFVAGWVTSCCAGSVVMSTSHSNELVLSLLTMRTPLQPTGRLSRRAGPSHTRWRGKATRRWRRIF